MPAIIDLPKITAIIKLADWLELNALLDGDFSSSLEDLISRLRVGYSERDFDFDQVRADISSELLERQNKMASAYPFNFNGRLLCVIDKGTFKKKWAYLFCLLVSYIGLTNGEGLLKAWKKNETARIFEEIAVNAASDFLACSKQNARILMFGWPRLSWPRIQRPFSKALPKLQAEIEEGHITEYPIPTKRKDAGLDLVAWRPFPDGKTGKLILLGHCAAGSDYMDKLWELDGFFRYYDLKNGLVRAFFIPHEVEKNVWFELYAPEIGIVFDRSRIAFYAQDWENITFKRQFPQILKRLKKYRKAL